MNDESVLKNGPILFNFVYLEIFSIILRKGKNEKRLKSKAILRALESSLKEKLNFFKKNKKK